jgi:hypothetical protein
LEATAGDGSENGIDNETRVTGIRTLDLIKLTSFSEQAVSICGRSVEYGDKLFFTDESMDILGVFVDGSQCLAMNIKYYDTQW